MPVINKEVFVDVTINPQELAEMFWNMGCDEQAAFFNHLGLNAGHSLCYQLQAVIDEPSLTAAGLQVMQTIGEYANGE